MCGGTLLEFFADRGALLHDVQMFELVDLRAKGGIEPKVIKAKETIAKCTKEIGRGTADSNTYLARGYAYFQ